MASDDKVIREALFEQQFVKLVRFFPMVLIEQVMRNRAKNFSSASMQHDGIRGSKSNRCPFQAHAIVQFKQTPTQLEP